MRNRSFVLVHGGLLLLCCCGGGVSPPPSPPNLQLSPVSLSFGVEVVGSESAAQTETLTNTGGSELVINGVAVTGTSATDFDENDTCGSGLDAGASCTLDVTFTPSQLGQRSAAITITDDAMVSSQLLSLTGVGGDSGPNATVSPTSLAFGDQNTDTTSAAQTITLNNYGTATLNITGITASSNFSETSICTSTLASGASCTVSVTFTPGSTGSLNGTLSFADSAADSPQIVPLSGTGVAGACRRRGEQCYYAHPCCPGLQCVAASTRAFCE
jgi:centrosomal CEP192-like protein/HYDIN/CFA65/VesB family protein